MRRRAVAAALAVAIVFPSGAVRAAENEVPEIEEPRAEIVLLLADYGRAYVKKDEQLLAGTVAERLRAAELRALRNAKAVPFRTFRLRVSTQFSGDLASRRVKRLYPGRDAVTYHVMEESSFDVERGAYVDHGAFTFIRGTDHGPPYGGWRLASKSDLDVLGFFSPYHIWDGGPVAILRSPHFLFLTHAGTVESLRALPGVAEQGYARLQKFWPRPVTDRYAMIVPSTSDELGRIIHETVDLGKFVAFTAAGASREHGWTPTYPRFFVQLSHLQRYGAPAQTEIFAHELVHAVTRKLSGPHVPIWIEEGLANAGGGTGGRASLARAGEVPGEFPTDERFVTGSVRDIQAAYDQGQVGVELLIDTFGREALVRFYETLGAARVVPGTERYQLRQAVSKSLEWSLEDWVARWRERLR